MSLIKKITLKNKIYIVFFSISLVVFITSTVTIKDMHKTTILTNDMIELRAPSAQSSAIMSKGVSHALAALRGWMLLNDKKFTIERESAWQLEIYKELQNLRVFSVQWTDPKNVARLNELEQLLPQLEKHQKDIELIANSAEDVPLLKILNNDAAPLADKIISELTEIINLEKNRPPGVNSKETLVLLADVRASMGLMLASLRGYLLTQKPNYLKKYNTQKEINNNRFEQLELSKKLFNQSQISIFERLKIYRIEFLPLPEAMIKMRQQPDWKLSNYWLATNAAPAGKRITDLLQEMKLSHQDLLRYDAHMIDSFVNEELLFSWVSLFAVMIFAIAMSILISRDIMRSVGGDPEAIQALAKRIALGDLRIANSNEANNSTGIYRSLFDISLSMKKIEEHTGKISKGEYEEAIIPRSDNDNLSQAINNMTKNLKNIALAAKNITNGDLSVYLQPQSVNDKISISINSMVSQLNSTFKENKDKHWLQNGQVFINSALQENNSVLVLSDNLLTNICTYTGASVGTLYYYNENHEEGPILTLEASYALDLQNKLIPKISLGEGIIGQAAKDKKLKIMKDLPKGYRAINSSIVTEPISGLLLFPFLYRNNICGVIELGFINSISSQAITLLDLVKSDIGIAFENININIKLKNSLEESQTITEELSVQKVQLEAQREILQETNEKLIKKSLTLESQKENLEKYSKEIKKQAIDLENSNKYKSEFLANMSHELRTPLNSLLILSRSLMDNDLGNLHKEDIESAQIIHESGQHLLALITEILDLSKIESGKMTTSITSISVEGLLSSLNRRFFHMAENKGISFTVDVANNIPEYFLSDDAKIDQILTNLIGNAIKFTNSGKVMLSVKISEISTEAGNDLSSELIFLVKDTGIGIAQDKQKMIFNAFQQANGSISRVHGGTGLGLSISNSFAQLLGGNIKVSSKEGLGSTFTLTIPASVASEEMGPTSNYNGDITLLSNNSLLIIEDDKNALFSLKKLLPSKIFKIDSTESGENAITLIKNKSYDIIVLDLHLTDMTGFELLDALSQDKNITLPPIIIYTGKELNSDELIHLKEYANSIIIKSVAAPERLVASIHDAINPTANIESISITKDNDHLYSKLKRKTILLVDDDMRNTFSLAKVLRKKGLIVHIAPSGEKALEILSENEIELVLMDIMMPSMDGFETIKRIRSNPKHKNLPIIALTAKAMPDDRQACLDASANDYLTKPIDLANLATTMAQWLT